VLRGKNATGKIAGPRGLTSVLALAALSFAVMQSAVGPALPVVRAEFRVGPSQAGWLLTATLLSAAVLTPVLGRLGDVRGRRPVLLGALGMLAVGTALAATAPTFGVLVAARLLQGFGGAAFPLCFGIAHDHLPRGSREAAIGVVSAMSAAGLALGVVLGGPLVLHVGFRHMFWVFLAPVLVALALACAWIPAGPPRGTGHVDWCSALLLSGWLSALLLGVSMVGGRGGSASSTLVLFAVAVLLGGVWLRVEMRSASPLMHLHVLRTPAIAWTTATSLLLGFLMYSAFAYLPQFAQAPPIGGYGFGADPAESATFLLPWACMAFVLGVSAGPASRRAGARGAVVVGATVTSAAFVALLLGHGSARQMYVWTALLGSGSGLAFGALPAIAVGSSRSDQLGVVSGMTSNARIIGGALGTQAFTAVLTVGARAGEPTAASYERAFGLLAAVSVGAVATALALPRSQVAR
jgi:MFS family permease